MASDIISATDSILGAMNDYWTANAGAIVSPVPVLLFEATEPDLRVHPAGGALPWARVVVRHGTNPPGAIGGRSNWRSGNAWVQVFVPYKDGAAYTLAQGLANVARKAYEGKRAGAVSFNRVDVREVGAESNWYRVDVVASFTWNEIRTG